MTKSTCPYCGDEIIGRRVQCGKPDCHRQYQNERCRTWGRENRERTYQYGRTTYQRECIICGDTFETRRKDGRYCGTEAGTCKQAWPYWLKRTPLCSPDRQPTRAELVAYRRALRADPCAYCGAETRQLDHIEPKANGGPDGWQNRAGTCASCNGRKQDVPMLIWMAWKLHCDEFKPWDEVRRGLLTRN